ncbi:MAG: GTP-binding protein [archaeon]|nr:GTP-binding protein [archaeon]
MSGTQNEFKFKIMIIGESSIGKTSFIGRYTNNNFKLEYISTVGIDFQIKNLTLKGKNIKLQIWDTAGQERFRNITKNYFQSSQGFIIAYDITDRPSFESITKWVQAINESASSDSKKILIGTKCDKDGREVSSEEGKALADSIGSKFYETSAKDNINVTETFESLTMDILMSELAGEVEPRNSISIGVNGEGENKNKEEEGEKKNCC